MNRTTLTLILAAALTACASAPDTAKLSAPTANTGIGGDTPAGLVDLAAHKMPGTPSDYDLRARALTLAPGGGVGNHPHAGRPGIVRVVKGTVVEGRGDAKRVLKAGEFWLETAETSHWFVNPSATETAELWVVDIVPKKK
ncbi:cupin domain-containing protein [Ottowia testudinis]|uniref:Cupin domain-containing protein n=1 Tax=Ottowia testudinis TaxID=2816950 RepID=A0A975H4P8_9BURK|nr:cupin domain-containing protein [Ottowia testudinis]QTD47089.1 cupin domain-containing protein [Ottowia testudinis]